MKVLITGHKGFIGRHVFADWRRELGYAHVRGIDHPDCVSSFKGGDFDLVIHLAAWADIRESIASPDAYYINNVIKAKPLFDWCRETDTRLLYASSLSVINIDCASQLIVWIKYILFEMNNKNLIAITDKIDLVITYLQNYSNSSFSSLRSADKCNFTLQQLDKF